MDFSCIFFMWRLRAAWPRVLCPHSWHATSSSVFFTFFSRLEPDAFTDVSLSAVAPASPGFESVVFASVLPSLEWGRPFCCTLESVLVFTAPSILLNSVCFVFFDLLGDFFFLPSCDSVPVSAFFFFFLGDGLLESPSCAFVSSTLSLFFPPSLT